MRHPAEYLTDTYVEMVGQLFGDVLDGPSFCAQEFTISHGHLMSEKQKKALSTFCDFWEALEELEHEHEAIERRAEEEAMSSRPRLDSDDLYDFLKASGFEVGSTGGGCTAWMRSFQNAYVMVSSDGDDDFGSDEDVADCGIYVGVMDKFGEVWQGTAEHCGDVPQLVESAMAKALKQREAQQ